MKALLLLASVTGNTETFIPNLIYQAKKEFEIVRDFQADLDNYSHIAIGSYTWGNGKIPDKMKRFLIENKDKLKGKKIFIFGSGNSIYPHFCRAVDSIKLICEDCGADVIGIHKFEQRFNMNELSASERLELLTTIRKWSKIN